MARHVTRPGAFYTYVAQALGPTSGVAAAYIALLSYSAMQVGLYGAIGAFSTDLIGRYTGWHPSWLVGAVAAWALVGLLGVLWVDLSGRILVTLLTLEIVVVVVFDAVMAWHPTGGRTPNGDIWTPVLTNPGQTVALLVVAVTGFVGFEATVVFTGEARDPARTMPTATRLALAVPAVLLAGTAWALTVHYGLNNIVAAARTGGPDLMFAAVAGHMPPQAVAVGRALLITSLLAALISFHANVARYGSVLAGDHVLPGWLARTSRRTLAPVTASLTQSGLALAVLVVFGVAGWEPLRYLFGWFTVVGGLGVLILMTLTCLAVVAYFRRDRRGETRLLTRYLPGAAFTVLTLVLVATVVAFGPLLNVPAFSLPALGFPALFVAAALAGVAQARWLRRRRRHVYDAVGGGSAAAL
jgi:amino acid transporter